MGEFNTITKADFLKLMRFPAEWHDWGMYPQELFEIQKNDYKNGNELASEHTRFGAFIWWIHNNPSAKELTTLFLLTYVDPDQFMANDARQRLRSADNYEPNCEKEPDSN